MNPLFEKLYALTALDARQAVPLWSPIRQTNSDTATTVQVSFTNASSNIFLLSHVSVKALPGAAQTITSMEAIYAKPGDSVNYPIFGDSVAGIGVPKTIGIACWLLVPPRHIISGSVRFSGAAAANETDLTVFGTFIPKGNILL